MAVTKETKLASYEDFAEANANLMSAVYNDTKLTASQKLKDFSLGVRNQVLISRDIAARRKELLAYGLKPGDDAKALVFNPEHAS